MATSVSCRLFEAPVGPTDCLRKAIDWCTAPQVLTKAILSLLKTYVARTP